jgi:hypothetical protein
MEYTNDVFSAAERVLIFFCAVFHSVVSCIVHQRSVWLVLFYVLWMGPVCCCLVFDSYTVSNIGLCISLCHSCVACFC